MRLTCASAMVGSQDLGRAGVAEVSMIIAQKDRGHSLVTCSASVLDPTVIGFAVCICHIIVLWVIYV